MKGNGTGPETSAWTELLEDTAAIAEGYREDGWEAVVLEPDDVTPVEHEDRVGLSVEVSMVEYDSIERLIEDEGATFSGAEVYYRPAEGDDRRFVLAVERDEVRDMAVFVPLTYALSSAHGVFERALREEALQVHVRPASATEWIVFSHGDPSLFLEESDVQEWETF